MHLEPLLYFLTNILQVNSGLFNATYNIPRVTTIPADDTEHKVPYYQLNCRIGADLGEGGYDHKIISPIVAISACKLFSLVVEC